jgi:nucleoside-diphosphate kinase
MQTGPVIALAIEGVDAVACVRKLVGATYPDQAAPGTIRGDFAHQSKTYANVNGLAVANLVHASASRQDAKRELDVWFSTGDLHEYGTAAQAYVS